MTLTTTAFTPGDLIPTPYTADGRDLSPPLTFANIPENTRELALICDDPDAPTPTPWVHWVIYKIPPDIASLPEGVTNSSTLPRPPGTVQGLNSWNTIGYRGPAPPPGHGLHHYHFVLYALDTPLDIQPGLDKNALLKAMEGHILVKGELVGVYGR